jgi:hypothetical protein
MKRTTPLQDYLEITGVPEIQIIYHAVIIVKTTEHPIVLTPPVNMINRRLEGYSVAVVLIQNINYTNFNEKVGSHMCPYFNSSKSECRVTPSVSDAKRDSSWINHYCNSSGNCKDCGNYEAAKRGDYKIER